MFPSTDTPASVGPAPRRRTPPAAPRTTATESFLRRVAGTLRAFTLLEDPELEARIAGESTHHPRRLRVERPRRPGAIRTPAQPCSTPIPR